MNHSKFFNLFINLFCVGVGYPIHGWFTMMGMKLSQTQTIITHTKVITNVLQFFVFLGNLKVNQFPLIKTFFWNL